MHFKGMMGPVLFLLVTLIFVISSVLWSKTPKPEYPHSLIKTTRLSVFPCADCHDGSQVNRRRRRLTEMHTDIRLKHAEQNRWCLDCHDPYSRNYLRLANGERVTFLYSFRLCGQCHGTLYRDWKAGVHGKRIGEWNGRKEFFHCVNCHNPHNPRFRPVKPKPPPVKPEDIRAN